MKLKPLKDKKKIDLIFEKGSFIRSGSVAIKFYDFNKSTSEYGVSVPKKIFPSAVTRNKIKRQVRSCVDDFSKKSSIKSQGFESKLYLQGRSFFVIINHQKTPLTVSFKGSFNIKYDHRLYEKIYTDLSLGLEKLCSDL